MINVEDNIREYLIKMYTWMKLPEQISDPVRHLLSDEVDSAIYRAIGVNINYTVRDIIFNEIKKSDH